MEASKCANCGEPMLEAYTRDGLRLFICPHLNAQKVKDISGRFYTAVIYCHLKVDGLKTSFERLMKSKNSTTTLETLRTATHETVNDARLCENANLAVMLGIPADELPKIFEATYKLALSLGIDIDYGITSLCKGIARKRMVILDNIGVTFNTEDAYEWFAKKHKVEKLTEDQRDKAWKLYAIKTIKEKANEL
jgi:hypothetical protein